MIQHSIFRGIRIAGIMAIGLVAYLVPSVGANHVLLAGALIFVCAPLAFVLELYFPVADTGWSEPYFDVVAIVVLTNLVPESWQAALLLGALLVGASGVSASRLGMRLYALLGVILILGMAAVALVNDVPNWHTSILVLLAAFPSVLYFVYWEERRSSIIRHRAASLQSAMLVAGGVAHDFNNLFSAILGNAELARLRAEENGTGDTEELDAVVEGIERAALLSNQLLAFSGRQIADHASVDLEVELRTLRFLLMKTLPPGSKLDIVAGDGPYVVDCAHSELQQVFMNVILNAGEAAHGPAEITVVIRREPGAAGDGSWLVTEIEDRGRGIPQSTLARIFEPLVTSKGAGYGLGLVSVKRIVESLGGDIRVQSTPGMKTRVVLRFPESDNRTVTAQPSHAAVRPESSIGGCALVVDDEEPVRDVVCRQLNNLGMKSIAVADGQAAVSTFAQRQAEIDLVVLDLRMPGMDGWECLRALRDMRADVPVLIISGYDPDQSSSLLGVANTATLKKPFRAAELVETVQRLVGRR